MNIKEGIDFTSLNRDRWKRALIDHFRSIGYTHALTLTFNRNVTLDIARSNIRTLHGIVDRTLLGPRYHRKPITERTQAAFVFEGTGPGGYLHAHSLWRIGQRDHLIPFAKLLCGGAWERVVPSGTHKLDLVSDPASFAAYALKAQHMGSDSDGIVWSDEFVRL